MKFTTEGIESLLWRPELDEKLTPEVTQWHLQYFALQKSQDEWMNYFESNTEYRMATTDAILASFGYAHFLAEMNPDGIAAYHSFVSTLKKGVMTATRIDYGKHSAEIMLNGKTNNRICVGNVINEHHVINNRDYFNNNLSLLDILSALFPRQESGIHAYNKINNLMGSKADMYISLAPDDEDLEKIPVRTVNLSIFEKIIKDPNSGAETITKHFHIDATRTMDWHTLPAYGVKR